MAQFLAGLWRKQEEKVSIAGGKTTANEMNDLYEEDQTKSKTLSQHSIAHVERCLLYDPLNPTTWEGNFIRIGSR